MHRDVMAAIAHSGTGLGAPRDWAHTFGGAAGMIQTGAGRPRTRDQRIDAPPFMAVADRSRIGLSTNRLRCSLDTHGCR
jgi:hypothetical protein